MSYTVRNPRVGDVAERPRYYASYVYIIKVRTGDLFDFVELPVDTWDMPFTATCVHRCRFGNVGIMTFGGWCDISLPRG